MRIDSRTPPHGGGGPATTGSDEGGGNPEGAGGDFAALTATANRLQQAIESVIEGKPEVVRATLTVLFAGGHLLIEDVPGVGKTMLARRWPGRSTAPSAGSSSRPTCCPAT